MINYKKTNSKTLIRVINLGEKLMNKIIKKRNIYLLGSFNSDSIFMDKLIKLTNEALIINNEVKIEIMEMNVNKWLELEGVGLTGNSLIIKATHIDIWNKLNNKSKTRFTLKHLLDGIILVLESLAKVFQKLEYFVELWKLLINISKIYADPYLP